MTAGRVFVYGGKGALGSVIVAAFKRKNYWVGSIDLHPNEEADHNILVTAKPETSWTDQEKEITEAAHSLLGEDKLDAIFCVAGGWAGGNASSKGENRLDAIFCVAGGWAGGNASSKDFIKNADMMWKQSVWSSCIAAKLAANHLKEGGLLTLTGAEPALDETSGMMGYGMAKAAVHQLVKSLSGSKSGLPANSVVTAMLPVTLDTPMNRKWMPDADQTTWTPLEFVSDTFAKWTANEERPAHGSLIKFITKDSKTDLIPV